VLRIGLRARKSSQASMTPCDDSDACTLRTRGCARPLGSPSARTAPSHARPKVSGVCRRGPERAALPHGRGPLRAAPSPRRRFVRPAPLAGRGLRRGRRCALGLGPSAQRSQTGAEQPAWLAAASRWKRAPYARVTPRRRRQRYDTGPAVKTNTPRPPAVWRRCAVGGNRVWAEYPGRRASVVLTLLRIRALHRGSLRIGRRG
jgi:hypothetical protein